MPPALDAGGTTLTAMVIQTNGVCDGLVPECIMRCHSATEGDFGLKQGPRAGASGNQGDTSVLPKREVGNEEGRQGCAGIRRQAAE